jgi:flagellar basal body-associated protein FliL
MKSEKYSALKIIIIIQKILGVIAIIAGAFAISSFFEGGGAEVFLGGIGVFFSISTRSLNNSPTDMKIIPKKMLFTLNQWQPLWLSLCFFQAVQVQL